MKANSEPDSDEPLRDVLRQWTVATPLPPGFQDQVWSRIQRAEARRSPGWWSRLVGVLLPRPGFALAYLSIFLALGMAAGAMTAQHRASRLDSQLGLRYMQSIDPYLAGAPPQ